MDEREVEHLGDRCIKVASNADPSFQEPRPPQRFRPFERNQLCHGLPVFRQHKVLPHGDMCEECGEAPLRLLYADGFRSHARSR